MQRRCSCNVGGRGLRGVAGCVGSGEPCSSETMSETTTTTTKTENAKRRSNAERSEAFANLMPLICLGALGTSVGNP